MFCMLGRDGTRTRMTAPVSRLGTATGGSPITNMTHLCLRVEPGDQIDANSFSHFLGGKAVERTPPCVLHNSVHLARIALRQLVYIAVHMLNIYMPKKIGKREEWRAKLRLPVRTRPVCPRRHLRARPMFLSFLQCFTVDKCRLRSSEYLCLTLLQQR